MLENYSIDEHYNTEKIFKNYLKYLNLYIFMMKIIIKYI